ncbi:MAG: DnaJ domain-containing protein [Bacteroidia bacterium]
MSKDNALQLYKILEIARTATTEDVKRAYRSKAKVMHPDVNNSPKANELFLIINEAYEVLIDANKRYLHDLRLDYIDKSKAESLYKKQYYSSSIKKENTNSTEFNSVWKEKDENDYYKKSPLMYNLFFASGMFVGFLIIFVVFVGIYKNVWPFWTVIIAIPGIVLVKEGLSGITHKKVSIINLLRRILK